jgi:hypothetical protein
LSQHKESELQKELNEKDEKLKQFQFQLNEQEIAR